MQQKKIKKIKKLKELNKTFFLDNKHVPLSYKLVELLKI